MIHRVTVPSLFPPPVYSHASVVEAGTRLAFLAGSVAVHMRYDRGQHVRASAGVETRFPSP